MPTRDVPWPNGTPTWVDLGSGDIEAAKGFYSGLFGWDYLSGGEDSGGYLLATLGGKAVAGIGPKQESQMPTVWTTYLASDNVDATARKVETAGGQLIAPPFDVMDSGRMAIAADTAGAAFGIWQAGTHIGAERFNEHGALCWNELHTREYDAAATFYPQVFDIELTDISTETFTYATFNRKSDGEEVGGVHHDGHMPEDLPNYWLAWFAADDVDLSVSRATELGASVLMPPTDSPFGRMSVIQGPEGEALGLITLPTE